jgi:flavocytochrome c
MALDIKDSVEQFYQDTLKSARDLARPELIKVLTGDSAPAVEWLQDKFALDLSLVGRLGGHTFPRTHRGKEQFPGMTITYALMEGLEDLAVKEPHRAKIVKKAKVENLIKDSQGNIIGVEYQLVGNAADGQVYKEYGPVILATGGYAADFTDNSLLKQHRPELWDLSTTNGDHCTGDGIKMAAAAGANTVDLEKVQVHPTGLVDPKEPDAKVKFLAAEALRGCGGLLLDADGNRFCDELGHRDYVTGMMNKNKFPIRLILNTAASKEIEWHCRHYEGRGLMRRFENGEALAKEMGIAPAQLEKTFETYNSIADGKIKDPWGKRFFHNVPIKMSDYFYVALMQPVLHYTMVRIYIYKRVFLVLIIFETYCLVIIV